MSDSTRKTATCILCSMFSENASFYFIGIGGVSMSALALYLADCGYPVRGSDMQEGVFTQKLRRRAIAVDIGDSQPITENTVVYTGAIEETHPQKVAAKEAGKRLLSRSELLGLVAEGFPQTVSVAGCHGKTSATSMLAHIFYCAKKKFTSHIGGEDLQLGNYYHAGHETFVTEACEFQRSFLSLYGGIAVILNIDRDHTDCYNSDEELFAAYAKFAAQAQKVVVNADDIKTRSIPHALSFGLYSGDIRAEKLISDGERYTFTVTEGSLPYVRISLNVVGKVHVLNALAAYAAARLAGFSAEEIKTGLESFHGVSRRFERIGEIFGAPLICDYAHHPREIAETFKAAQSICKGTVRLVFQPHTYTRTKSLMREFIDVLQAAENPIIYKTYAAREKFDGEGSAYALVARLPEAIYVQSPEQLRKRLEYLVKPNDMILVLGAGDIYEIAKTALL